ncbi:TIM-barrel domain-containing protein [Paenibacillus sp. GYB003]|uniref:TIM-barrel domain-containing protein n=1 Tax=Paenibacillus sp. GYB003 TaxID=2994392 RepID=UPI002F96C8F0
MSPPIRFQLRDGAFVCMQAVSEHTFRIRFGDSPDFPERPLFRYGIWSAGGGPAPHVDLRDTGRTATLSTRHASLSVDKEGGSFALSRPDGITLTHSSAPPQLEPGGGFEVRFRLADGERLYGLGDKATDRLQVRGIRADMRTVLDDTRVPVPFLMSSAGWGILLSTTHAHTIDIGLRDHDTLRLSGTGGGLDLFLIAGDGLPVLLDRYTDVTGKPLLLPMWAYGLTFISNQYADARDIIEDGLNFRRENIPCDMIGLEPGWMETYRDCSTSKNWHPERFAIPDWSPKGPRTFLGALHRMGFKLSLWLCCSFDVTREEERLLLAARQEAESAEAAEKTEEAWYDHLQKFVDQGVSAFKVEGFHFDTDPGPTWANGLSSAEMHHLYPLLLGKQMHNGFANQTGRRSLVYSMNGYAGIQQYAATWAGYQHESAIRLLNQTMSGNANALTDMDVHSPAGIHFGFLQTLSQVNSWAYWQHPSLLEPEQLQMFRMYAKLRYRLLPYLYSAAAVAARSGLPVMRAMPLGFPDDPAADRLTGQYMLGDSLLVALNERVHLPAGGWIDYWTGTLLEGPREIVSDIPSFAGGPLFVRAGAIIPVWPDVSHVGPALPERIGVLVYPYGESGEAVLYEDDGVSFGYRNGEFAETKMSFRAERRRLTVRIEPRAGAFSGMPAKRGYDVTIRAESAPAELLVNGAPLPASGEASAEGWRFDRASREIRLTVDEAADRLRPADIELRYETNVRGDDDTAGGTSLDRMTSAEAPSNELIRQVVALLNDAGGRDRSLNAIAERIHVNASHLSRLFKREMGVPFSEYALKLKMEQAKRLLLEQRKIGEVADRLGFTDSSHFVRAFRNYWGITPGKIKPSESGGAKRSDERNDRKESR